MTRDRAHKRETGGQTQRQKFIEAARELGCDESEEAFKEALKRVAKAGAPSPGERGSKGE